MKRWHHVTAPGDIGGGPRARVGYRSSYILELAQKAISVVYVKLLSPKKTSYDVLQQSHGLLLDKLGDHVTKNSPHCVEPFICLAYICQPHIVKQYLLHNKDSHCFRKL